MWHNLTNVANTNFLDESKFVKFAEANKDKYSIVDDKVSSWYVSNLIQDFIMSITVEEYTKTRQNKIDSWDKSNG